MITCVTNIMERRVPAIRRLGRKLFDMKELDAHVYLKRTAAKDTLTVLDKNYNRLLVENVKPVSTNEKERITQFYTGNGRTFTIRSTQKKVSN